MDKFKEFICPTCGKRETVSVHGRRLLCAACSRQKRRERGREHDKKRRPRVTHVLSCKSCQSEFIHEGIGVIPKYCNKCKANYSKIYEEQMRGPRTYNSESQSRRRIKHRYGISKEQYSQILQGQSGLCLACNNPPKNSSSLCLDHDHSCCPGERSCGKCIRGLICQNCNIALGQVRDDIEILKAVVSYLDMGGYRNSPNANRLHGTDTN